jgi:hypothetical protein
VRRKKSNWFNRSSKSGDVSEKNDANLTLVNQAHVDPLAMRNKKKNFGLGRLFKKNSYKENAGLEVPSKFSSAEESSDGLL